MRKSTVLPVRRRSAGVVLWSAGAQTRRCGRRAAIAGFSGCQQAAGCPDRLCGLPPVVGILCMVSEDGSMGDRAPAAARSVTCDLWALCEAGDARLAKRRLLCRACQRLSLTVWTGPGPAGRHPDLVAACAWRHATPGSPDFPEPIPLQSLQTGGSRQPPARIPGGLNQVQGKDSEEEAQA